MLKVIKILKIIRWFWIGLLLFIIGFTIIASYFSNAFNDEHSIILFAFVFWVLTFPAGLIFLPVQYFFGTGIAIAVWILGYYIQWFLLPKVIYNIYSILFAKGKRKGAIVIDKR